MAIALRPFDSLNADLVTQTLAETVQRVQEDNPQLDLRRGVFADLLAYYHSLLDVQRQENINDYLLARSLKALEDNPDLADPDLVDDILSNYLIERQPGANAAGDVMIVVSDDVTVTIAQGAVFSANGRLYTTTSVFTAKAEEGQVVAPTDRLFTRTSDGNWTFTISVVAEAEGPEYAVRKDALVVPQALPPNYVTSFAASDFTGGLNAETNADMLQRLRLGIAAKTMSNRTNMEAMLRTVEAFSRIIRTSIIGFGDPEQVRGFRSIFPISLPGRVDWYIRSQEAPLRLGLTKTATLLTKNTDGTGVWQFALLRDDAPGFYEVDNIRPIGVAEISGGFSIVDDVRGLDLTGTGYRPDVADAVEAAYSRFSTAVITFTDTLTDHSVLSEGDTADYTIEVVCQPSIGEIQDFVSGRDIRGVGSDCLVKAPVPCFVAMTINIAKATGEEDPDVDAMKTALCHLVNTIGFVGKLAGSRLQDVIYGFLAAGQTSAPIDMIGRLRYPSGTTAYLRDADELAVPDDPANMVSHRTVQFFMTPDDVGVSITTLIPSD